MPYNLTALRAAHRQAWRKAQNVLDDELHGRHIDYDEWAHEHGFPHRCAFTRTGPTVMVANVLRSVARRWCGSVRCFDWHEAIVLWMLDVRGGIAAVVVGEDGITIYEYYDWFEEQVEDRLASFLWADPQLSEKVADAITQRGQRWNLEPFPADWLEQVEL